MTTLIEYRVRKVVEAWEALSYDERCDIIDRYPLLAARINGLSAHIEAFGGES